MSTSTHISCILLAAGSSRRMGQINKLLLPFKGQPMICHTYQQIAATSIAEIILVSGHEAERVKPLLPQAHWVHNSKHLDGMTSTIQAGIRATSPFADGFMIALADMPFLTTKDYQALIDHFSEQTNHQELILQPTIAGKRGNPIIFGQSFKAAILSHQQPNGCKAIVQAHQEQLQLVELNNDQAFVDIDTPTDYENWQW